MVSAGITVNFPKWVIWVTDIASWVTYIVSQYWDKRYVHCLYSIMIRDMWGRGYAASAWVARSLNTDRPTCLEQIHTSVQLL